MKNITYKKGDATNPFGDENKIIIHVCNDIGGWGRGFVLALSKKWEAPEMEYKKWFRSKENFQLGEVQFVQVEDNLWVANMIGQRDVFPINGVPPIRYEAVQKCLEKVAIKSKEINASIQAPRFGAGLAGGDWNKIEELIKLELVEKDISVTIYDF